MSPETDRFPMDRRSGHPAPPPAPLRARMRLGRRHAVLLCLAIIGGPILGAATSITAAYRAAYAGVLGPPTYESMPGAASDSATWKMIAGDLAAFEELSETHGMTRRSSTLIRRAERLGWQRDLFQIRRWSTERAGAGDDFSNTARLSLDVERSGWPFTSLYAVRWSLQSEVRIMGDDHSGSIGLWTAREGLPAWAFDGFGISKHVILADHPIPMRLATRGFILNGLLGTASLIVVGLGGVALRSRIRRWRRRCQQCGYPIQGGGTCQECGERLYR